VQHSGKIGFSEYPIFGTRLSMGYSRNFGSPVVGKTFIISNGVVLLACACDGTLVIQ
jgi:hypothetical protein